MDFNDITNLNQEQFTARLGAIYEHSPWIASAAWKRMPFNKIDELHRAMANVVLEAPKEIQLNLILEHPELAGKAAIAGNMAQASKDEQKSAGLDQCSPEELAKIQQLNQAYRDRFGFPFIIAVRGRNRHQIIEAMEQRLQNDPSIEFNNALDQINQIALLRLNQLFIAGGTASTIRLPVKPLSKEAFAPYGDVIQVDDAAQHFTINEGSTERYHDLANIDAGPDGKVIVSIFRGQARPLPITISMMERHPLASQAFIPMGAEPYLVVVAKPESNPTINDLEVFYCTSEQGVNYAKGVWHHPLLALNKTSDFLVVDRSGPGDNCDVVDLEQPATLAWPE